MKAWHVGLIIILAGLAGHRIGYSSGLRDCPQFAAHERATEEAIERDVSALLSAPSGRDKACDSIFEIVADDMRDGIYLEQEDRSLRPYPVGE